jgi:hypothetical protein
VLPPRDDDLLEALASCAKRAVLAFSAACAEWVLTGLELQRHGAEAWDFLDACWASIHSLDFQLPDEPDFDFWSGPEEAICALSLITVLNTRYGFDEDNPEIDGAFAASLVQHVYEPSSNFTQWQHVVLSRLTNIFPRSDDRLELCLPRHIFSSEIPIDEARLEKQLSESLQDIRLEGNRYLERA